MNRERIEDESFNNGKAWMETFTGRRFYLLEPRTEDVCIEDIAHALARLCRFTGHVREFYSVAQHCVLVSHIVPAADALKGLLHDAAEAYVGDSSRPLKQAIPRLRELEIPIQKAIFASFGLSEEIPETVHRADIAMVLAEKRALLCDLPWAENTTGVKPASLNIAPWDSDRAENVFLSRFEALFLCKK